MKRRLWPFTLIYLVGAVLAFLAVRGDKNEDQNQWGKAWKKVPFESVKALFYQGEGLEITLEPLREDLAWIRYRKGDEDRRFLSHAADNLQIIWKNLDPIWAQKNIGKKSDLRLEEFGLDNPSSVFRIDRKDGGPIEFQIGKRAFLNKAAFVLDRESQDVFLWSLEVVGLLSQSPQKLALTQPLSFVDRPLESLTLALDGKTLEWTSKTSGKWLRGGKTEDIDFAVWFDKLQKVTLDAYPSTDESQKLASAGTLFDLSIKEKGAGAKVYQSRVLIMTDDKGPSYWLKDERFPTLLRLDAQRMSLLKTELEKVKNAPSPKG